jgi:tRNA threonylcarbamoyladenosine biosynthesis protein TsaE
LPTYKPIANASLSFDIELEDAPATARVGAALAAHLQGGDTVALIGDLGAGKTTLCAGIGDALGVRATTSPTFSLVNEYPGGRLIIWHVDLYRIDKEAELVELGLDEMIGNPRGVLLVEWADKFLEALPRDHLRLEMIHEVEDSRRLIATGTGPRGDALVTALKTALGK